MGSGAGKAYETEKRGSIDSEAGSPRSPTSPGRMRRFMTMTWDRSPVAETPVVELIAPSEHEEELHDEASPFVYYHDSVENHGFVGDFYIFDNKILHKDKITSVRKVTHKTLRRPRALKQFSKKNMADCSDVLHRQIALLQSIRVHPNIARLYETFEDKMFYYLVFEFCLGGRLLEHIKEDESHTEREAANVMQQILRAVVHLQEHRVCHRDIKPEHLLIKQRGWLADCLVKIIDFSHAKVLNSDTEVMHDKVGTPFYSAPGVHLGSYTRLCDVWSCGVVMHLLLFGFPAPGGASKVPYSEKQEFGPGRHFAYDEVEWDNISAGGRDLLSRLLQVREEERVAASRAVEHAWTVRLAPQPSRLRVQLSAPNLASPSVFGAPRVRLAGDYPALEELFIDEPPQPGAAGDGEEEASDYGSNASPPPSARRSRRPGAFPNSHRKADNLGVIKALSGPLIDLDDKGLHRALKGPA